MSLSASVVVPSYNSARFLGPTLESALAQSCDDFEVLVVDDGSTDDSCEVARRYDRVRLLEQSHLGSSAARNLAVREARSPVIAFLDSDDLWHRDHLETLLRLMRQDPDVIGATSGMELLTADGTPTGQRWVFGGEDLLLASRKGCPFLTSVTAVRRDAMLLEPFDESLSTANDWELWLRLLLRGRFALAGRATAGYRRHGGAISMDGPTRARNRRRIVAKHAGQPWAHELAAYMELHDVREAFAAGRTRDAEEGLARAARHYPDLTADLQWWPFFESFRPHDHPEASSRSRFWQAVGAYARVCGSRALPFRGDQRRRSIASGLEAAAHYAHIARLRPEALGFRVLARLARAGLRRRPAPPSGSGTGLSER